MYELIKVLNKSGQLVVTTRQVCGDFEREHNSVLKTIEGENRKGKHINGLLDGIINSSGNPLQYFVTTSYKDNSGKVNKEYLLTRDGFSLLVMGFTGAKALEWKLKYIKAFNDMEQTLKDGQPKLSKELQAIFVLDTKQQKIDERIGKLENNMTIDYSQQLELSSKAKFKVIKALDGKDAPAYKILSKKAFSEFWKDYKRFMNVNSYRNTAVKDLDRANKFMDTWKPTQILELAIYGANSQMRM